MYLYLVMLSDFNGMSPVDTQRVREMRQEILLFYKIMPLFTTLLAHGGWGGFMHMAVAPIKEMRLITLSY